MRTKRGGGRAITDRDVRPVLLLGATGLLGGAVGKALTARGVPVRALLRSSEAAERLAFAPSETITGDLAGAATEAVRGADRVLYLAATSVPADSPGDPAGEIASGLPALNTVLRALAAGEATSPRILFPSSGGSVYGETHAPADETTPPAPRSSYALGKRMAEELIGFWGRTADIGFDILRLTNVYGAAAPRRRPQGAVDVFLDDALAGRTSEVWGSTEVERDFLFVDDAADAVVRTVVAPCSNRVFNVANGRTRSLAEVLDVVARVTEGRHRWVAQGGPAGVRRSAVDASAFKRAYDWSPRWNLEEGVAEAWGRKQAHGLVAARSAA